MLQASALSSLLPLDTLSGFQQICKPFFRNFNLLSNITHRTTAATDGERQRTGHSCKARWDGVCPDTTQRQRYVCKLREITRRKTKGRSLAEYNSFVHYKLCFIHFHVHRCCKLRQNRFENPHHQQMSVEVQSEVFLFLRWLFCQNNFFYQKLLSLRMWLQGLSE